MNVSLLTKEGKHLDEYYIGMPCMLGDVVGKIVGESEKGSMGVINDVQMFSIVLFGTPHGTIIETGISHLSKITEDGAVKLFELECEAKRTGHQLYHNKLPLK